MIQIAAGHNNRNIAERLSISPATVKRHVEDALAATGCRTRPELTFLAAVEGAVRPQDVSDAR